MDRAHIYTWAFLRLILKRIVEEKYVEEGHDYNICIRQTAEDCRCDLHPKIEKKSRNKKT